MAAVKTSMAARLTIRICAAEENGLQGFLYSSYFDKTVSFSDALEMLRKMECIYDGLSFPQSTVVYRRFRERGIRQIPLKGADATMAENEKPVRATFVVHVKYRQNATWQGSITWTDKNITRNFRSAFEMLKLMDNAVADSEYIVSPEWVEEEESGS